MALTAVRDEQLDLSSINQLAKFLGNARIESSSPTLTYRESDETIANSLWRTAAFGTTWRLDKNTNSVTEFATFDIMLEIQSSSIFLGKSTDISGSLTVTGSATSEIKLRATSISFPDGAWRLRMESDLIQFQKNLSGDGSYTSNTVPFAIGDDVVEAAVKISLTGAAASSGILEFTSSVGTLTTQGLARLTADPQRLSYKHSTATRLLSFMEDFVVRETPSGTLDGANVTFTLSTTPVAGTEQIYLNGILQDPGATDDYTISGATITYNTAPVATDRLVVTYIKKS